MKRWLAVIGCLTLLGSSTARAAELTAFLAVAKPGERWAGGAGGAFGVTFFKLVHFEAEVAHLPGEILDQGQWSAVGSALLAPAFGRIVPYAGLGVGGYRQTDRGQSDNGVVRNLVLGVKLNFGLVLVKGEYRKITLPEEALLPMTDRFSVGAGISF
jgi:hypothetical protein